VTDEGMTELAACKCLRGLHLAKTKVPAQGIAEFTKALPDYYALQLQVEESATLTRKATHRARLKAHLPLPEIPIPLPSSAAVQYFRSRIRENSEFCRGNNPTTHEFHYAESHCLAPENRLALP